VDWTQTPVGLVVKLPAQKLSEFTCALKIAGTDLKPVPVLETSAPIPPDAKGNFVLTSDAAELHGEQIRQIEQEGESTIGFWDNPQEWVCWKVQGISPGWYAVSGSMATVHEGAELALEIGQSRITGQVPPTGDWGRFRVVDLGRIEIKQAGDQLVTVRAKDPKSWKAINLRSIQLVRQS
jgi:hypothetical protein